MSNTITLEIQLTQNEYDRLQSSMFGEQSMSDFAKATIVNEVERREDRTLESKVQQELYDAIRMTGFNIGDFDVHDTHILPNGADLDDPQFEGEWVRIAYHLEGWQSNVCLIYNVDTGAVSAEYVEFRHLDPSCVLICEGDHNELVDNGKYNHRFSACESLMAAEYDDLHDALEAFRILLSVD